MDELDYKALEQIPIPDGLEERLSKKIDEWEKAERVRPTMFPRIVRYAAVAASVALVFGIGFHYLRQENSGNLATKDTYENPLVAQQEAERALNLLATNLNKGMAHLERAKTKTEKSGK